jgi:aminoglycoside phosphotransferase family enzyme/predicted kinase
MTADEAMQQEVFAFLADPATHGGETVRRIDTHAAAVFLAGERALKVKRAVHYCFLDFSTLASRRAACTAEIEVNRRLAPTVYRGVVPITRGRDGKLMLGGDGEPLEWAVEMRRFDERLTLDHLAAAGRIDAALADALGHAVAAAHRDAPQPGAVAPAEWIAALARYVEEQHDGFAGHPDLFDAAAVDRLAEHGRAAHARAKPLLVRRGEQGSIRRIHGDLHLGNIVLLDGRPVLFDAIEFSPLIATGDLIYDVGFLVMDLIKASLAPLGRIVLERYLMEMRDADNLDALAALPLFMSVRAQIRANVAAARRALASPDRQGADTDDARAYFRLAQALIAPPAPVLIAVGGLSGTGKTALARALAPQLAPVPGALVLRSDVVRKTMFGAGETERLPAEAYTAEATARVYARLGELARRAVAAGHSVVVDAVFAQAHERAAIATVARDAGVAFAGLFLTADLATRVARVSARAADASDADAAVAQRQEDYRLGDMTWTTIDASGTPTDTLMRAQAATSGCIPLARPA